VRIFYSIVFSRVQYFSGTKRLIIVMPGLIYLRKLCIQIVAYFFRVYPGTLLFCGKRELQYSTTRHCSSTIARRSVARLSFFSAHNTKIRAHARMRNAVQISFVYLLRFAIDIPIKYNKVYFHIYISLRHLLETVTLVPILQYIDNK